MSYVFEGYGTCRACGAALLWWRTPRGKRLPVDDVREVLPQGPLLEVGDCWSREEATVLLRHTHFASCPGAHQFRGRCRICNREVARAALVHGLCKRCARAAGGAR